VSKIEDSLILRKSLINILYCLQNNSMKFVAHLTPKLICFMHVIWLGKGCSTVLIPARVVQALQLHFDKTSAMSRGPKVVDFPPLRGTYLNFLFLSCNNFDLLLLFIPFTHYSISMINRSSCFRLFKVGMSKIIMVIHCNFAKATIYRI
jgi:hypothetical protein